MSEYEESHELLDGSMEYGDELEIPPVIQPATEIKSAERPYTIEDLYYE